MKSIIDCQIGNLFDGKRIIANNADINEINYFFGRRVSLINFDVRPLDYIDCIADVQNLAAFDDNSFDVFYSVYVLNHVTDDNKALAEMHRVISDEGFLVVMVPFHMNSRTHLHTDITQNYGRDVLEKYGVGSYRYYGYADLQILLSEYFQVRVFFAVDPISMQQDAVFICRKRFLGH